MENVKDKLHIFLLSKSLQKFDIIDMYYYMTFNDVH